MRREGGAGRGLWWAAAMLSLVPRPAAADATAAEDPWARVVLVGLADCCPEAAWVEAEAAVRGEFTALGFAVDVVPGGPGAAGADVAALTDTAREHGAVCALRVVRSAAGAPGGVELWIADRVTGKAVQRRLPLPARTDREGAAAVVALRAVELLRASLTELRFGEVPGEVEPPPPAVELAGLADEEEGPIGLRTGVALLGSPGGVAVRGAFGWAVGWSFWRPLALEVEGVVTFPGSDVQSAGAAATFDLAAVRGWLLWTMVDEGVARPVIGAGGGALVSWAKGRWAESAWVAADRAVTGYVGGTVQLAFALSRLVWLRAGVDVGASLPATRLRFAGVQVAVYGEPLVEAWLDLEIRLP